MQPQASRRMRRRKAVEDGAEKPVASHFEFTRLPPRAALREIRKERARRSLKTFVEMAWPYVEADRPFQNNWHLDAICEHLEAVTRGEIRRLLILIPPGTMKSLSVSVFWPAWVWGPRHKPGVQFMFTSYTSQLSVRDSIRCRRLIRSGWYQELWGSVVRMVKDRDTLTSFQNTKGGYRLATSVEGVATGERGDIVVADDPHNVHEVESDAKRQSVIRWWDEAMTTRVNDPSKSAFVCIMQRVHSYDLAGHLMEQGGYTVLSLPMEFESGRRCITQVAPKHTDWVQNLGPGQYVWDPRHEEGELLWPDRYPREVVEDMKSRLGSYASAAQFQMRPAPRQGGLIRLDWFRRYQTPPASSQVVRIVQSWDTADKGGQQHAYSVCLTFAQTATGHYLLDVFRQRMNIPDLERAVVGLADRWRPSVILIEDAASGTAIIQSLRSKTSYSVLPVRPAKDKVTRMDVETPAIEAGNVFLPEYADWLPEFEAECRDFPNSRFKDQVDALSQYLGWVRKHSAVESDWNLY